MGFSKTIALGSKGSLSISESLGKVSLNLSLSDSIGGGAVAGVASVGVSAFANVEASELANALFELIESKSPAGIQVVEKAVQAEVLKLLASS